MPQIDDSTRTKLLAGDVSPFKNVIISERTSHADDGSVGFKIVNVKQEESSGPGTPKQTIVNETGETGIRYSCETRPTRPQFDTATLWYHGIFKWENGWTSFNIIDNDLSGTFSEGDQLWGYMFDSAGKIIGDWDLAGMRSQAEVMYQSALAATGLLEMPMRITPNWGI